MARIGDLEVQFVPGSGSIVRLAAASRALYDGIRFTEATGGHGVKTFALWPLDQAARCCFGTDTWPEELPEPNAWLEFDVDDVDDATLELEARGYRMLVRNKKEPWGQIVSRFLSPDGLLVGIAASP